MKKVTIAALLLSLVACKGPDPFDLVREARRGYNLELDMAWSEASGEVTYEIKVQNQSGGEKLHEITVFVSVMDTDQKPIWSKQHTLDVTGLGNYANKSFTYKEAVPDPSAFGAFEYQAVKLAPDDKDSDFKNYKEFKRVAR